MKIKNIYGEVLLEFEGAYLRKANLRGADLTGADLQGSDLTGANLRGANLRGANLTGAYLTGAYLRKTNLQGANLTRSDLRRANIVRANLTGAYLRKTNLQGANLRKANLQGAYLTGVNLRGADLRGAVLPKTFISLCKEDFIKKVKAFRQNGEVKFLMTALEKGKVNGTKYEGECACLLGTLTHARGKEDAEVFSRSLGITPDGSSPSEVWFWQIKEGDTPE
ncbi:MAG: hypothetical protein ACI8R6_000370, partial [Candidatus Paceibacteria bacterium]